MVQKHATYGTWGWILQVYMCRCLDGAHSLAEFPSSEKLLKMALRNGGPVLEYTDYVISKTRNNPKVLWQIPSVFSSAIMHILEPSNIYFAELKRLLIWENSGAGTFFSVSGTRSLFVPPSFDWSGSMSANLIRSPNGMIGQFATKDPSLFCVLVFKH